jgi:hypothetical protein
MAINKVTDAINTHLQGTKPGDEKFEEVFPAVFDTLPNHLKEIAGDRVRTHFPLEYQHAAIACVLANRLVYNEGINFVEAQPDAWVAERAIEYYKAQKRINKLLEDSETSPEAKTEMLDLIRRGGARTALGVF